VHKNVPIVRYGFPRVEECLRIKPMGDSRKLDLWLVWMSQAEFIADVDDAVNDG
jgi:hypothetical protein